MNKVFSPKERVKQIFDKLTKDALAEEQQKLAQQFIEDARSGKTELSIGEIFKLSNMTVEELTSQTFQDTMTKIMQERSVLADTMDNFAGNMFNAAALVCDKASLNDIREMICDMTSAYTYALHKLSTHEDMSNIKSPGNIDILYNLMSDEDDVTKKVTIVLSHYASAVATLIESIGNVHNSLILSVAMLKSLEEAKTQLVPYIRQKRKDNGLSV